MTQITTEQIGPNAVSKLVARALFFKDVDLPALLDSEDYEVTLKVFTDEDGIRQTSTHLVGYTGDTAQSLRDERIKDRQRESAFRLNESRAG